MRRICFILSLTLVAWAAVGAQAGTRIEPRDGWIIHTTQHSYSEIYELVKAAVKRSPVNIVTRASATVGAKSLGKSISGNMVVGIYGPQFAVRMLEASVQAGIEAPLRLYITEDEEGVVTLSYKVPSVVFAPYASDGGAPLIEMAAELDLILADIIQNVLSQ